MTPPLLGRYVGLLHYKSLFVGQLYADKSLTLRVRDLLCFTTDQQTVIYYSTIYF